MGDQFVAAWAQPISPPFVALAFLCNICDYRKVATLKVPWKQLRPFCSRKSSHLEFAFAGLFAVQDGLYQEVLLCFVFTGSFSGLQNKKSLNENRQKSFEPSLDKFLLGGYDFLFLCNSCFVYSLELLKTWKQNQIIVSSADFPWKELCFIVSYEKGKLNDEKLKEWYLWKKSSEDS